MPNVYKGRPSHQRVPAFSVCISLFPFFFRCFVPFLMGMTPALTICSLRVPPHMPPPPISTFCRRRDLSFSISVYLTMLCEGGRGRKVSLLNGSCFNSKSFQSPTYSRTYFEPNLGAKFGENPWNRTIWYHFSFHILRQVGLRHQEPLRPPPLLLGSWSGDLPKRAWLS